MKLLKKVLCGILSATMLITSASVSVMAKEEILTDDNIFFLYHTDTNQDVRIMQEERDSEGHGINTKISGNINIPSKIKGYDVTGIDIAGFSYCPNIKSVTIPNTVKTIGHSAFNMCTGLESAVIPYGVTTVGDYAFAGCESLKEIDIPNSVTSIGEGAFAGCKNLKEINIPNSVTSIGELAVTRCENLETITLSSNLTNMPAEAFHSAGMITDVKIPNKVNSIGKSAFSASLIQSIYIPKSVIEIEEKAFSGCILLKNIYYEGTKEDWKKIKISSGNDQLIKEDIINFSSYNPNNQSNSTNDVDVNNIKPTPNTNTTNTDISVYIDNKQISFDVPPQIINDRTMVPLRAIFEALGASVDWNQETRTVTSTKGDTTIKLTIDSNTMYVNDNSVTLDTPACVVNDRTLVPVRAISEAYNTNVNWNGDIKTVTITSSGDNNSGSVSYADISANINQINDFISRGMYIEAMQECDNAKANYTLSDTDINILNDLYNSAQSKYNDYLQSQKQEKLNNVVRSAVAAYVSSFKNPSSAQIYSIYAGYYERSTYNEDISGSAIGVVIDASGQNSFGGITRNDTTIIVDEASGKMTVDLEAYGKKLQKQSYGKNYIKALNIQNEALFLQLHKTEIFQSFDVKTYFK